MNDHELDEFFREAAAKSVTPDRREEVWANLEKKLDAPRTGRNRKWVYLLILLMVILGFGLWPRHDGQTNRELSPGTGTQAPPTPGFAPSTSPVQQAVSRHPGKLPVSGDRAQASSQPSGAALPAETAAESSPLVESQVPSNIQSKGSLAVLPRLQENVAWPVSGQPVAESNSIYGSPVVKSSGPAVLFSDSARSLTAAVTSAGKRELASRVMHWRIGITAGPDWSSVAARGWGTGVGGGLTLGYRLNNRWALSTAVLVDKKIYNASPADYNPLDNSWRNYNVQHIDANCIVVDVPINVSYTAWSDQDHRILVTTGLSSLWMDKEEYTYHYKTTGGDPEHWSEELYGKNYHPFSIVNLSAGYQRSWKHISFEVAPYVKIPLHGIGYGRVKLLSTGVHFTLGYGLK